MYDDVLKDYSDDEIKQICKHLNRDYNIYDPDVVRWNKIRPLLYKTNSRLIDKLHKESFSNEFTNYLLLKYYACERVIKYYFIKKICNAKNDIVAFEMSIGDSRVDICRANGKLCAYEIKTEYDNYKRIGTQMRDYSRAFEYVFVIVPNKNKFSVKKVIPENCGIIVYRNDNEKGLVFSYSRSAKKNKCDISFCLENLSNNDLKSIVKRLNEVPYKSRKDNLNLLNTIAKEKNIWSVYKAFIKNKYKRQWYYLKDNMDRILPIDCQSFFSASVNPSVLYDDYS